MLEKKTIIKYGMDNDLKTERIKRNPQFHARGVWRTGVRDILVRSLTKGNG
jgi:hypothetical protein